MLAMLVVAAVLNVVSANGGSGAAPAAEQPDRAAAMAGIQAQKDAMKKLEFLAGDWEGTAKFDAGRGMDAAVTIRQSEAVRMKLGGRVLLVEGTGRAAGPDGEERVVFEALATVGYDPKSKAYTMRAFGPEGTVDPKVDVGENRMVWSFAAGGMQIRYTIHLDEKGRWIEVGERSSDEGKTWTKFIEMELEKKAAGGEGAK